MPSDVAGAAMTDRQRKALRDWQNRPVQHYGTCHECGADHSADGRPLYVTGHRRNRMRCRSCALAGALTARERARQAQLVLL